MIQIAKLKPICIDALVYNLFLPTLNTNGFYKFGTEGIKLCPIKLFAPFYKV
jgi:hypothetical protein